MFVPVKAAIAGVLVLAIAGLTLGLMTASHHNSPSRAHARVNTFVAGDKSFSLSYPSGWHATAVGQTAAVLERTDHRGVVLVHEGPALTTKLQNVVKDLPRQLAGRFPDFRPVGASATNLSTGPAVVYTFVRTKAKKVQTIVVAPTAKRSFTLQVAAPSDARDAAREAGQIVRSLKSR